MAVTPSYRSAEPLRRDKAFAEFYTPAGTPNSLLAIAQGNLGVPSRSDVTLTQAQIQGMFVTPVTLVPGVAGKTIVMVGQVLYRYASTGVAYTGGGNTAIMYRNGQLSAATAFTPSLGVTSWDAVGGLVTIVQTLGQVGDSLIIGNATAAFAGGGGTLRVIFNYLMY